MKSLIYIVAIVLAISGFSQTTHYTKFLNTPLDVNPALLSNQQWTAMIYGYRSLNMNNSEGLSTNSATFLTPITLNQNPFGGAGLSFFHDQLDNTNTFTITCIQGAFSYDIKLTKRQKLSGGVSLHYGQYNFSLEGLSTGSQYVKNAGFKSELMNGEEFRNSKATYLSYSPGFLWDYAGSYTKVQAGFSITHINEPKVEFGTSSNKIYRSFNLYGGISQALNSQVTLKADLLT